MAEPLVSVGSTRLLDGIIRLDWTAGGHVTGEAARKAQQSVNRVSPDRQRPMLVNMVETASVARQARQVFTEPSQANPIALLGRSPVDRVIANFVLGVFTPPCPTRYFTSEADALNWIRDVAPRNLDDGPD